MTLQQTIGNRAASRLLAGASATKVQAKLTIGEPGDKYEQEADKVASQVVEQLHAPASAQSTQGQSVQRQDIDDEELQAKHEITALQRQDIDDEELQAKPSISDLQHVPLSPQVQREVMPMRMNSKPSQFFSVRKRSQSGRHQRIWNQPLTVPGEVDSL
ncbi:MAG: hypothetical protein F6K28_35270 [Microcoleus sp. SIO2G3]|nr:hypothetical protein [Microcoleus sp. SIO2G3]